MKKNNKNKETAVEKPKKNQAKVNDVGPKTCKEKIKEEKSPRYEYPKRSGTSGISGQLYETKLLSLLLIRALNDKDIKTFSLETNVAEIGDLDDVVFRYNLHKTERSSAIFVQAKHRDHPEKEKVTVNEVLSRDSDFSLYRYLDSYLKIKYKFKPNNSNPVFRGCFKDVDCKFIIYTPAIENFYAQKLNDGNTHSKEYLLKASKTGKTFNIDYEKLSKDHIDTLIKTIRITRIELLAKRFVKLVMKDNSINMMKDDLIKTYHVFLSENMIQLSNSITLNDPFATYEFRDKFFSSDDYLLTILRESILKETLRSYGNTINLNADKVVTTEEIIKNIKLLPNKVPKEFGNQDFHVDGDQKREKRINYISNRLKMLIESADSSTNIIKVDDSMLGLDQNSIFMEGDIKKFKIGGLVGNLLVLDAKLNMLKLNPKGKKLSDDAIKVYKKLKEETKLNDHFLMKYRFDINVHCFPRLTLFKEEHDIHLLSCFLDSLTFYTNQAQENYVEEIVKEEIEKLYNTEDDLIFRIKRDAIFLEAHDKIQQWWKKRGSAPDLTKDCKYFKDARKEIISNPLLSILNLLYTKQINKTSIQFHASAIQTLSFISETKENIINIISTEDITLTSIKLLQYFKNNCSDSTYIFVDFDFVIKENYFPLFISELKELNTDNLIIISKEYNNVKYLNDKLKTVFTTVTIKVTIITHSFLAKEIMLNNPDKFRHEPDNRNRLSDLDSEFSNTEEFLKAKIVFQGEEVSLNVILNKEMYNFVNSEVLYKVINAEKICIGRMLTNSIYSEIKSYYENQNIWRCINLNIDKLNQKAFNIIKSDDEIVNIQENKDIIFLSNSEEKFNNICDTYQNLFNIHWFVSEGNNYIWRQSNGSLKEILIYIERLFNSSYLQEIETVKDFEGITIIGAEAGMGKSTFLSELATKSKAKFPFLWIANINLLDYTDEFDRWHEDEIDIAAEADLFLCRALCVHPFKDKEEQATLNKNIKIISNEILELITTENGPNIRVKSNSGKNCSEVTCFELELFNYYYSKGQIAVLFDGFDEICPDYMNEVIQLIEILKRRIKYIWITTRPYNFILNKLEEKFGTFSHKLQLWSTSKQKSFLMKYFIKKLEIDIRENKNIERLKYCCDHFLKTVHLSIDYNNKQTNFTEIPLHIYMIAEIFLDAFKKYYKTGVQKLSYKYKKEIEALNLITLYERFADVKFNILFVEKNPYDGTKPVIKKIIDKERKDFLEYHKNIAAYTLFDKSLEELFSAKVKNQLDSLIETAKKGDEKTGIINEIVGNEPKFVHYTFAEYFATEFLCDKLLSDSCTEAVWIYLVDKVLTNGYEGVRKFFNSKLATKSSNSVIYSNALYSKKHLTLVLNQMFIQTKEFMGDISLYIAIEESLDNIATFLLTAMKTVLNEDNLDNFIKVIIHRNRRTCVFCATVAKKSKNLIGTIISCVTDLNRNKLMDIFKCEDNPNNPFIEALTTGIYKHVENKTEMLDFILTKINDNNVVFELFARPYPPVNAVQFLINRDDDCIKVILKHLKKLKKQQRWKLFSAKDQMGKTPTHYAMSANDIKFYSIMKSLLDIEQFNEICSTPDFAGETPMRLPIARVIQCWRCVGSREPISEYESW